MALDDRFGEPVDAYVNGSQVWLRDDGPGGVTLEWRLHPVAALPAAGRHRAPTRCSRPRRWRWPPEARRRHRSRSCGTGSRRSRPTATTSSPGRWPRPRRAALTIEPDAFGLVDHEAIAAEWERTRRGVSIVADLLRQLEGGRLTPVPVAAGSGGATDVRRGLGLQPVVQVDLAEHPAEAGQAVDDGQCQQLRRVGGRRVAHGPGG